MILSTGSTLDSKLAAIEAAIKAQTITAEGKLDLIKQVLESQNTTLDTKLAAIEAAIKEQTIGIEAKMDLVKGVLDSQNTTLDAKLTACGVTPREMQDAIRNYIGKDEVVGTMLQTTADHKQERVAFRLVTANKKADLASVPIKKIGGKVIYLNDLAQTKAKIGALEYIKKELSGEGNFVQ